MAQEHGTPDLGEARERKPADQREPRDAEHGQPNGPLGQPALEQALEHEPLTHESIERRQSHDRGGPDEKQQPRERHGSAQAAQQGDLSRPGGVRHRAGPEKQESLEQGVVGGVQRSAGESQHRDERRIVNPAQRPEADANQNDPDVLDRVVRQQTLQIVLSQGPYHPEHARDDPQQQDAPPPPGGCRYQTHDPEQTVDPRLDHHARHDRGNVARGGRVSLG